ncbi:MAG: hypothetical protein ABID09_07245 [Candidatus Omnitrophota bacterium]
MRAILLALISLLLVTNLYAAENNLNEMFKDMNEIKVYLREATSTIDAPDVDMVRFKEIFNDVLTKRINMSFVPVANPGDADLIIDATVKGYVFKEKVMPSIFGTAALVADTTAPKSAAKLVVDYTIYDPKDNKILATYKNFTTDARHPVKEMEDGKAFALAATKNANRFIYRAFYEQQKRD